MTLLIINADDFGHSHGVNIGIIKAYQDGILSSTTMMANMAGFEEAVTLSKENPGLKIGAHLCLTAGRPVLKDHKTIVDKDGAFFNISDIKFRDDYSEEEIYREWDAQIKKLLDVGIKLTHLDSHHHAHSWNKKTQAVMIKLARKYKLPVRNNFKFPDDIKSTERFITHFDDLGYGKEEHHYAQIKNLKEDISNYDSLEIMCHPAYIDKELYNSSSLLETRILILDFLINSEFAQNIKNDSAIILGGFDQL